VSTKRGDIQTAINTIKEVTAAAAIETA